MADRFVTILAGGSGTRLWPLSRSARPKQLLHLVGAGSLLRNTFERVRPLVPAENVLILTERSHAEDVRRELPELPPENILVEPARRGTAACLGLAALLIQRRSPGAVWASLHSDAFITDDAAFRLDLEAAFEGAAELPHLILLGIRPSFPSTQFGYLQAAEELHRVGDRPIYRVSRFVEKPDHERATEYLATGQYYWNPGVFVWSATSIASQFATLLPTLHGALLPLAELFGGREFQPAYEQIYPTVQQEAIDTGIMERAPAVAMIPATFSWADIGSWKELYEALPSDAAGNAVRGDHVTVESSGNLVFSTGRRLIATIGLNDLVIVDTDDALLICRREQAVDVRRIVEQLAREGRTDLL
jgi:mannose-1-phosphate guanylyltransferase